MVNGVSCIVVLIYHDRGFGMGVISTCVVYI